MTRRLHRTPASTPRRPLRNLLHSGAIVALSIVLAGTASGVTFALWHANATVSSTASSADLELTTSGFDSLSKTFGNHTLTTTGSFTVTNATVTPSSQQATYSVSLDYSGNATLAGRLAVATWPTSNPSGCAATGTTPAGAVTGTWAAFPANPAQALSGNLAKQQSASYCVRVSAAERGLLASTVGAMAIQPRISATLALGGWSDTATASTAQATAWIYPAYGPTANTWYQLRNQATNKCIDVNGAATASGTATIDFACKAAGTSGDANQHWKFTRTSGDYYDITPRNADTLRLDVVTASTQGAINVATDASSQVSQEWQVQAQPGGVYQIVNRLSGLCLQPSSTLVAGGNPQYVSVVCDGSAAQRYTFSERGVDVPAVTLVCGASTSGGGVTYTWTGGAVGNYTFTAQPVGGGSAITLGSAAETESSFTVLPGTITGGDGEYNVTATWNGNTLDSDKLWKTTTGSASALTCAAPPPPLTALTCAPSGNLSVSIGWGHTSSSVYRVELWSIYGEWVHVKDVPAGQSSTIITAPSSGTTWENGTRTLRVVSGFGTSNQATAEIQVEKSGGGWSSHALACMPMTVQVDCTNSGNYGSWIRMSWPTVSGTTGSSRVTLSYFGYDLGQWDVERYGSGNSMSRITITDDEISGTPSGSYTIGLMLTTNSGTTPLEDQQIVITGSNNKDIRCG